MRKFFRDFKKFITRGNVIDMAVGVIVGGAFSAIVTALTNKILMPLINYMLGGGNGLEGAYTFLKRVDTTDANGNIIPDLANSIYIDWGAFITAIINFLLIALILFIIIKVAMSTSNYMKNVKDELPTREERKELKEAGVKVKTRKELVAKTAELRAKKQAEADEKAKAEAEANKKPTTEELLADIKELLAKQVK